MARKGSKTPAALARARPSPAITQPCSAESTDSAVKQKTHRTWSHLFSELACKTAHFTGKPLAFLTATFLVVVWACTGPLFHYSDTWQLVINTSTTIVTFLMVFLIQHTQNRDTLAVQLKLSELIIAVRGAENRLAAAEDMTEDDLERLHQEYRVRAEQTLDHLEQRRGKSLQRAS
jgi:low affinity Fe/Cu permease